MKPTLVTRYRIPTYPLRAVVLADPDLLRLHVPPAWRATRDLAGAAAVFLAANTAGCAGAAKAPERTTSALPVQTIVAPLFDHGVGTGVSGCVVVAPSVYLSEEEAMRVIAEEMESGGIELSQRNVVFDEIRVKVRGGSPKCLVMDGYDPKRRIAVEFVSMDDYMALGGHPSDDKDYLSTVSHCHIKGVAQDLTELVKLQGLGGYYGVFYDPVHMDYEELSEYFPKLRELNEKQYWKAMSEITRSESLRHLREQVKDFVDWLKAQGAL